MAGYPGTQGGHAASGPKPKRVRDRLLHGTATAEQRQIAAEDRRETRAEPEADGGETSQGPVPKRVERPHGLRVDEKKIWDQLAPHAVAAHTLSPQTIFAFRTLVETRALRLRLLKKINRDGWVVSRGPLKGKRHALTTTVMQLHDKETTAMLRFCLHAAGRELDYVSPLPTEGEGAVVDKWAKFDTPSDDAASDASTTH